jgi:hypothetical protein
MNIIRALLFGFISIFVSFSVFAMDQDGHGRKIIYCPEQLKCFNDVCNNTAGDMEYLKYGSVLQESIYYFTGAGCKEDGPLMLCGCNYSNQEPFKSTIVLSLKNGSNFVSLIENSNSWKLGNKSSYWVSLP